MEETPFIPFTVGVVCRRFTQLPSRFRPYCQLQCSKCPRSWAGVPSRETRRGHISWKSYCRFYHNKFAPSPLGPKGEFQFKYSEQSKVHHFATSLTEGPVRPARPPEEILKGIRRWRSFFEAASSEGGGDGSSHKAFPWCV